MVRGGGGIVGDSCASSPQGGRGGKDEVAGVEASMLLAKPSMGWTVLLVKAYMVTMLMAGPPPPGVWPAG